MITNLSNKEEWRPIPEHENYLASNLGRIKRAAYTSKIGRYYKERLVSQFVLKNGYVYANIITDGKPRLMSVHRLVAKAFLDNKHNLPQINHKNEIKTDNRIENLEWCTPEYNVNYGNAIKIRSMKVQKPVYQIDATTDKIVFEWSSATQAAEVLGIHQSSISLCANGKLHTAGGFKWVLK